MQGCFTTTPDLAVHASDSIHLLKLDCNQFVLGRLQTYDCTCLQHADQSGDGSGDEYGEEEEEEEEEEDYDEDQEQQSDAQGAPCRIPCPY